MNLNNLSRNTLSKQVLDILIEQIEMGKIKPGERLLTEKELMDQLGVSRPVIREALSSLESIGIISKSARGGTFLNEKVDSSAFRMLLAINSLNYDALIEARLMLEIGFVTIATKKIKEEDLNRLEEIIISIEATEGNDYGELDKEFHTIIAKSVDNPILEGMIESLLYVHHTTDEIIEQRDKELTVKHHKEIVEALRKRDSMLAYKAMYEHLSFVQSKINNIVKKKSELH